MKLNKYIPYVLWSLLGCAVLISLAFVSTKQRGVTCTKLSISIDGDNGNYFIENNDVIQLLNDKDKQPVGKLLNEINTALLENIINSNPYVANAEVFSTLDGVLHITIRQRNPIIQILNNAGESYYIDEDAYLMPISENYTPDVIVASGQITEPYTRKKINSISFNPSDSVNKYLVPEQLFSIAKYLQTDSVANALFTQIYVNENNEIELVPRIGDHIILIGDAANFKKKVDMLLMLYRKGLNKTGWTQYSSINLKFNNQVICTRKNKQNASTKVAITAAETANKTN